MTEEQMLSAEDAQKAWDEEALKSTDPEAVSAPEPEPEPIPEPEPEPEADPLAGVSPVLLARLDELQKSNEELRHHVRAAEGRVAAWQREKEQQKQVVTPTNADMEKATSDPEKWTQLKEDFPEWAEAMEEYVASKLGRASSNANPDQINQLIEERTSQIRNEALEAIEFAKLETRHDDWKTVVSSPEFDTWIKTQPVDVFNLINSPKAVDAIKVMDLYKSANRKTPTLTTIEDIKNQRRATLSNAVSTKPGASRPSKTIDNMTPEELWNYEARQRDKRRSSQGF